MKSFYCAAFVVVASSLAGVCRGQDFIDFDDRQPAAKSEPSDSYAYGYRAEPTPRQIMQAKSQQRAAERMARIATLEWYGLSVARPAASATPFTGSSNRGWQTPVRRGFGFGPSVVIVR